MAAAALFVPVVFGARDTAGSEEEIAGITLSGQVQFGAFLLFEACVGVFWPSMMKMRSQYVPEEVRSTIINFFRIPLNLFVCVVLYNVSAFPIEAMFLMCTVFLLVAAYLQVRPERVVVRCATPLARAALWTPRSPLPRPPTIAFL